MAYGDPDAPDDGSNDGSSGGDPAGSPSGGHPDEAGVPGIGHGIGDTSGQTADQGGFGPTDHGDSAVADANRDAMRGWDSSPGRSVGFGSPTGSHPDEGQPGFGTSQSFDVDYGAYDNPAYDSAAVEAQVMGPPSMQSPAYDAANVVSQVWGSPSNNVTTQQMAHSVFDPGISLSTQQLGPNPASLSTQQLGQNVTVDPSISLSTQQLGPNPASLSTQQLGQNVTVGYVDPETTTLEAIAQQQHDQRQKAIALSTQQLGHNVTLGTPVEEVETETPLEQEMRFDFKNFYSALDDDDATEEAKALEIRGFLDHINRKNYTDTGFLSQFGIRSPQLTEREQIAQVKNFLGKHQSAIDALNKSYTDQVNQNPGLRQALPGYGLITGLMSLIGLEPQHTHPAVQALYDKMTELGMIEPETPEMTDANKIAQCNATPGYRWDSAKHACVRIEGGSTTPSTETASVASPKQAGIVWKPVSEADGNLVILTPSSFDSASVTITDAEGNVIDTGRSMGRTNGNRHTYRFSMPGAGYGSNVYLNIGSRRYLITDPAARVN